MLVLRHGQSYFNLHFNATGVDPGIDDPELTPLGTAQAEAAAAELADVALTRVIISPYTRAVQTAAPILAYQTRLAHEAALAREATLARHAARVRRAPRAEILHEVRERAAYSCDIGSHPERLAARFPQHRFDHLPPVWWHAGIETEEQTIARATAFRTAMAARDDAATTLVVSHWGFLLALTGRSLGNGELLDYDPRSRPPVHLDWYG